MTSTILSSLLGTATLRAFLKRSVSVLNVVNSLGLKSVAPVPVLPRERFIIHECDLCRLTSEPKEPIVVLVVGNEATDLDTSVSTVLASITLQSTAPKDVCFVPIISCSEAEWRIKTESSFLFSAIGISRDDLLFKDSVGVKTLLQKRTPLVLVDQNEIPKFCHPDSPVVAIFDHHMDHGSHEDVPIREIYTSGSAVTVILDLFLGNTPQSPPGTPPIEIQPLQQPVTKTDYGLGLLIAATILIDTAGLRVMRGRVTPTDLRALEAICDETGFNEDNLCGIYYTASEAKVNMDGFSALDMLKKDFKSFQAGINKIGISSLPLNLNRFIALEDCHQACLDISKENHLNLFAIMTAYKRKGIFQRELALSSAPSHMLEVLEDLKLRPIDSDLKGLYVFDQRNVLLSRKQVAPLLISFMETNPRASPAPPSPTPKKLCHRYSSSLV